MNNMNLYSTIYKRKSVRKFTEEPLRAEQLENLQSFIGSLTPLYDDIKTEIAILPEDDIKLLLPFKTKYYAAAYSEVKEGYLANVGFMLQQVDLYLSENGIGACWLGLGVPQKDATARNGMEYVIAIGFGNAAELVHRESISEFKRKTLPEISGIQGAEELLEAARLAPSASNTQPWYFSGSADRIIVCRKLPNILKAAVYGKFNRIDMGIALCHIWIAARHCGKSVEFIGENTPVPKEYEYITTAFIK